jgi:hypothetical protein
VVFTVTNHNETETRQLGDLRLSGPPDETLEFELGTDNCSGEILDAKGGSHNSCTVEVKFRPTSRGTKWANLLIPSNDDETQTLAAFVSNHEATHTQCCRRMPPVLARVDVPETMQANHTYTLTWSQEGYHDNYTSNIALFDCTGISNNTCGDNYDDATRFAQSGNIEPTPPVLPGNWQFSGVRTKLFNYEWNFTVPATRTWATGNPPWDSEGTEIVVRFYRKNDCDMARNNSSMSLLIPGNQSDVYYDKAGRRIVKQIIP